MTDLSAATRARIVEIAMQALDGCYLHQGHFGDTAAGMVADALIRNLPELRYGITMAEHGGTVPHGDFVRAADKRTAQDYRDAEIDDGGYVTWPRKGEPS